MTEEQANAYNRGYDLAASRAESRQRIGLPIERGDPYADRITPAEFYPDTAAMK